MKQGSTIFLRGVVIIIGIIVLALCVLLFPVMIDSEKAGYYRPILFGIYASALPFFFALYQTLKLLSCIDKNNAFSNDSVKALKNIKYSANTIAIFYALNLPFIFGAGSKDDAPGVVFIGLMIILASLAVAIFAAVLQKLLQEALMIKEENDLTV